MTQLTEAVALLEEIIGWDGDNSQEYILKKRKRLGKKNTDKIKTFLDKHREGECKNCKEDNGSCEHAYREMQCKGKNRCCGGCQANIYGQPCPVHGCNCDRKIPTEQDDGK